MKGIYKLDVDMILEKCPRTIVRSLLVYSTIQYGTTVVIIVMIISVVQVVKSTTTCRFFNDWYPISSGLTRWRMTV